MTSTTDEAELVARAEARILDALDNIPAYASLIANDVRAVIDNRQGLLDRITTLEARVIELETGLKPFADRVFNDNGDMTVNTTSFSHDQIINAYFALHARTLLTKGQKPSPPTTEDSE